MPASPDFSINGGGTLVVASVAAGATVTAVLDSIVGVRSVAWSIIRTDDTSLTTDYTPTVSGSIGQQVQYTALTAGTSGAVSCTINDGIDPVTNNPSTDMTAVAKFYVPTTVGLEVLNAGELDDSNVESSLTHGAVTPINAIIRAGGGSLGDFKGGCRLATAAALPAYNRVGNVITAVGIGALTVDGVATALNDRILLKDGAAGADNGLWYQSTLGDGATAYVLTRTTDANISAEVASGMLVPVTEGATNDNQLFMLETNDPITLNTTALTFSNIGALTPLVTQAARGTVSALTGSTVLTSDAASTAGGVWVSYAEAETPTTFPIRTATAGLLVNRIGLGVAEPTATGCIAAPNLFEVTALNALGTQTFSVAYADAADSLLFGATAGAGTASPASIHYYAATLAHYFWVGGVQRVSLEAAGVRVTSGDIFFEVTNDGDIYTKGLSNDGWAGKYMHIRAQDVTGAGAASTGGTFTSRGGDATDAAGSSIGGPATNRGGDAAGSGAAGKHTTRGGDAAGAGAAGDALLRGGRSAAGLDANVAIHADPAGWNTMERGIFEGEAAAVPTGNPVAGVYRYVQGGAAKVRGTGGTITTYGPAEPHCTNCGRDTTLEWENPEEGWHLIRCMWCDTIVKKVQK